MYYDGIKLNIANNIEGNTPLHNAAGYNDPDVALEMVETLINAGASAKSKLILSSPLLSLSIEVCSVVWMRFWAQ